MTRISGLEQLTNLDQLYLSHNGIEKIEGLETLVRVPCAILDRVQMLNTYSVQCKYSGTLEVRPPLK